MKIKFLFIFAFLCAFSINSFAQIKITPNKVKYTRTGEDVSEHKKTFEVTYPKLSGNGAVAEIEKTISYWTNFETNLAEETENDWLYEATYEVKYNNKGILAIELTMSGSAAYPDSHSKTLVVNLETGERIKLQDAFIFRTDLYNKIAQAQEKEIKLAISQAKTKEEDFTEDLTRLIKEGKEYNSVYEINEFFVSDKGVTFLYNYDFVHAVQALEPDGRYFFTWAELKPHVAEYGPLGVFVRK